MSAMLKAPGFASGGIVPPPWQSRAAGIKPAARRLLYHKPPGGRSLLRQWTLQELQAVSSLRKTEGSFHQPGEILMERRILNRKELRNDFDAAERRKDDDEREDEEEDKDEDEEDEEEEEGEEKEKNKGDDEEAEAGGDEDDEEEDPKKKKAPAKVMAPPN